MGPKFYTHTHTHTHTHTDRETERQTDRQTDRQTHTHTPAAHLISLFFFKEKQDQKLVIISKLCIQMG